MRSRLLPAILVALALWISTVPTGARPDLAGRAVAVAAEMVVDGDHTKLTVALSRATEATSFHLERPDRAVIELPDVNCQIPAETHRRPVGVVSAFRCGMSGPGRSRLVIELAHPAETTRLAIEDSSPAGVKHLVIELRRTTRDAFGRSARRPESAPETTGSIGAGPRSNQRPDPRPLVAIDAGHGGIDPGAIATSGDREKDIVLAFAQALRDRLVAAGRVRVTMIRDSDVFVALDERVRLARSAGADLFVSIHGDSITTPAIRGATIYTGAERATDAESARLAERENAADAAGGSKPPEASAGVSDILAQLTSKETRGLSHQVAGILHRDLRPVLRFSAQPHREAGFRVLRAPDMTSVLVELGYLSSAKDAELLLSDDWRRDTATAMAGAIERFFGPRLAGRAPVSP